ncbi:MAG: hypothetical protein LBF37_03230 [Rickettsiales bacterium]|jgi:hypothetical protein|nr:hypothetical protein [Rickettsiales bacterium]
MRKLLKASLLSVVPVLALVGNAMAACSDGIQEKVWDKTASTYCKIFFPECSENGIGKKLSYSREYADGEIICVGAKGVYTDFYKVSIKDANSVFKTDFAKMGANYTSDLSKWLLDNCIEICAGSSMSQNKEIEPVSQYDLMKADQAAEAQAKMVE